MALCLEALADLYAKEYDKLKSFNIPQSKIFKDKTINCLEQAQKIVRAHFNDSSPPSIRIQSKLSEVMGS